MVTRCICCSVTFAELLQLAARHGAQSVDELHDVAAFGTGCGLCLPYVARALATGKAEVEPELES